MACHLPWRGLTAFLPVVNVGVYRLKWRGEGKDGTMAKHGEVSGTKPHIENVQEAMRENDLRKMELKDNLWDGLPKQLLGWPLAYA